MQTMSGKGEIFSPAEILNKSCVKVGYITQGAVIGNISIISNKLDSDGKVTRSVEWSETFFNEKDGIYEGQFQYNGGNTFLKIETNIESGSLSFDYITVSKGDCSALNCPGNTFMCTDKTKCIQQKDRCNNHWNCKDGSDENACLNTFNCTFEDKNMCGFKSSPEYCLELDFGVRSKNPSRDHSKGTVYGQYIRLNCNNESRIILPKITMGTTFCLDFYYIFSGYGNLSVYNNNTLLMKLPKFDAEIWMNVNLTLSKGVHNISLVYSGGNLTTLAFDSVVTKQGKCPAKGCPENWYPCNDNNTCYPYTQKCDGIINCPNGEDEKGCASNKTKYKLTGGRDLWSGKLKMLSGSEYLPVCAYSISSFTLDTVCSQLGLK
ncbi:MAM and LDL-receptor class A domain-containing protein 1-like [Octopus sinensis]|uniref:MAM and LDL-receptor class A domain-containing protein 1-like n=1 Tax=Octopus sinensis TaxID=2607531 RepID=A0A7E6EQY6_9MOLL|nr:MAM and LDL-receptor class A domain-containing protein 1-like [Octopus sinensis]